MFLNWLIHKEFYNVSTKITIDNISFIRVILESLSWRLNRSVWPMMAYITMSDFTLIKFNSFLLLSVLVIYAVVQECSTLGLWARSNLLSHAIWPAGFPGVCRVGCGGTVTVIVAPLLLNFQTRGEPHRLDCMLDLCTEVAQGLNQAPTRWLEKWCRAKWRQHRAQGSGARLDLVSQSSTMVGSHAEVKWGPKLAHGVWSGPQRRPHDTYLACRTKRLSTTALDLFHTSSLWFTVTPLQRHKPEINLKQ